MPLDRQAEGAVLAGKLSRWHGIVGQRRRCAKEGADKHGCDKLCDRPGPPDCLRPLQGTAGRAGGSWQGSGAAGNTGRGGSTLQGITDLAASRFASTLASRAASLLHPMLAALAPLPCPHPSPMRHPPPGSTECPRTQPVRPTPREAGSAAPGQDAEGAAGRPRARPSPHLQPGPAGGA